MIYVVLCKVSQPSREEPKSYDGKFVTAKCSSINYRATLSLALLYLVDLFINKLKTKFNNIFLQNDFKYKKNPQFLLKKFPRKS